VAPSHAVAPLPEPVSPELALVDPILRRELIAALGRPRGDVLLSPSPAKSMPARAFAPAIPSPVLPSRNGAGARHAQERLGYGVAGVALTIGCAIGLIVTLPNRGSTNTPAIPAPITPSAGQAGPVIRWTPTPPAVSPKSPVVAASASSEASVQRKMPVNPNRSSKPPIRFDPFLPPDSADTLPRTTSNVS
jgi:hypothetical protein